MTGLVDHDGDAVLDAFVTRMQRDIERRVPWCRAYWVICSSFEHMEALRTAIHARWPLPNMDGVGDLLYVPRRLAILFFLDRQLRTAPTTPLDGVLLPAHLIKHKAQLEQLISPRNGWMLHLDSATGRGPSL